MGRPKNSDKDNKVEEKIEEKNERQKEDLSKNILNALLRGCKEDHFNDITVNPTKISTGSLVFDSIIGGGIWSGTSCRLIGPHSSGKSSQALLLMYNYLNTIPNSKGIYIQAEPRFSETLKERSGLKFVYNAEDWETGTVFVFICNVFEAIASTLEGVLNIMYENNQNLCCILDSLDQLILRKDLTDKDINEGMKVAGIPLMTKLFYRRLGLKINKYNCLMVLISQASAFIDASSRGPHAPPRPVNASGGAAAAHCMDVIAEYTPKYQKHLILEDDEKPPHSINNKILGHKCPITIRKSINEADSLSLEINIKHGQKINCVWKSMEVGQAVLQWELVKREGKTLKFTDSIIQQAKENGLELKPEIVGEKKFYDYFESNPEICNWFYEKFKSLNS